MENKNKFKAMIVATKIMEDCVDCEDVEIFSKCCNDTIDKMIKKDKILKDSVQKLTHAGVDTIFDIMNATKGDNNNGK